MKFKRPTCPHCQGKPIGTNDLIRGTALLMLDEPTGEYDYEGETKIDWDEQECIADDAGRLQLRCENGCTWFSFATGPNAPSIAPAEEPAAIHCLRLLVEAWDKPTAGRRWVDIVNAGRELVEGYDLAQDAESGKAVGT